MVAVNCKAVYTPYRGSSGSSLAESINNLEDHTRVSVLGSHHEWVFLPYTSTRSTSAWLSSHTAWISGKENMKPLLKASNHFSHSSLVSSPPTTLLQHSQWHVWNESKFNFDCCKVTPGDKIHKRTVAHCSTWGIISVVDTATLSPFMFSILLPWLPYYYFVYLKTNKNGSWSLLCSGYNNGLTYWWHC